LSPSAYELANPAKSEPGIERVDYDGTKKTVVISFHAAGIQALAEAGAW
jgi:hypothetical protein